MTPPHQPSRQEGTPVPAPWTAEREERTAAPALLQDPFGRCATSLRVSVTDRCNYRCVYCMPEEGVPFVPRGEILTYEEILRLVRLLVGLGVRKVRITGGEPLLRRDLPWFVRQLRAVEGLHDISLTTNGFHLPQAAQDLYEAGLRRLNVSLDTLRRERYRAINRIDGFARVMRSLEAAEAA